MSRATYVYCPDAGRVVRAGEDAASRRRAARDNGGPAWLAAPMVWGAMPATRHIIDGRVYECRRRYNDVTRAHGCVEIGKAGLRDMLAGPGPQDRGPTVAESLRRAIETTGF